jgi:hypothetical protein
MKIHLIRSEEVSTSRFRTISEIIGKFKGPIEFIFRREDISEDAENMIEEEFDDSGNMDDRVVSPESNNIHKYALQKRPWALLFERCETFRTKNKIKPEEVVILLTDYGNERNWFSSWEPSGKLDFFVQTSMWDTFIEAESCYPIIYELATIPLGLTTCKNLPELEEMAHQTARGCAFDYCQNKIDIQFKLRTGDICPDCREIIIHKNIDPSIVRQVFAIFDGVRSQMLFRQRFQITKQASHMEIHIPQKKLCFTDIGDVTVNLGPREMTVYQFFLNHPEGVSFPYMQDYRKEIHTLYRRHAHTSDIVLIQNRVDAIVLDGDSLSWLIHSINKKIRSKVGDEIAKNYMIMGEPGEVRRILITPELLKIIDPPIRNN